MDPQRESVRELVASIEPFDSTEIAHKLDTLDWIDSEAPLCRIQKPADPKKHLVSYTLLIDPDRREQIENSKRS